MDAARCVKVKKKQGGVCFVSHSVWLYGYAPLLRRCYVAAAQNYTCRVRPAADFL